MTCPRRDPGLVALLLGVALVALPLGVAGCGKKAEEKPKQTYAPPPPPPLAPLEDLKMDPRVQFPQSREPSTRALAEGIAKLASAIVSGDEVSLAEMLDDTGNDVLNTLVNSGQWSKETKGIEAVRVCVLNEADGGATCQLGLGVQDEHGAFLLAWSGQRRGDTWVFTPAPLKEIDGAQLAALDDASITPPSLPSPVHFQIDPNAPKLKPIERFSK